MDFVQTKMKHLNNKIIQIIFKGVEMKRRKWYELNGR